MSFIDGFVVAVPTAEREAHRAHALIAPKVFREPAVLHVVEAWGEDVPHGKLTDMHRAVPASPEESVVFSWIEWPSKAVRDVGMDKVFGDPRLSNEANPMPFDGRWMIFGGFSALHDLR
jgi:uncharacterized protein YbaA (DUF1428 family)